MTRIRRELRAYYEEEARLGTRRPPTGRRVELRSDFIELLVREGRRSVLDFGAGPASDGAAFHAAGVFYVGLDLAVGNAQRARAEGLSVVPGSITHPPIRPDSFDAGWSMSTLMHIPEEEVPAAISAMAEPLRPGAPLLVGLWGGDRRDRIDDQRIEGQRRLFSHRPFERNRELIGSCGTVETATTWDNGREDWEYHLFLVRIAGAD